MNRSFLFIITWGLLLNSCTPSVMFVKPQPSGSFNKNSFRNEFHGTFLSESDSTKIFISDGILIRENRIVNRKSTDQNDRSDMHKLPKDSLIVVSYDTIFLTSNPEHILRYFRKSYFLNYKIADHRWYVKKMAFNGEFLEISELRIPDDINILKEFGSIEEIRRNDEPGKVHEYILDLSRGDMKKLLSKNGFRNVTRYKRIQS